MWYTVSASIYYHICANNHHSYKIQINHPFFCPKSPPFWAFLEIFQWTTISKPWLFYRRLVVYWGGCCMLFELTVHRMHILWSKVQILGNFLEYSAQNWVSPKNSFWKIEFAYCIEADTLFNSAYNTATILNSGLAKNK